MEKGLGTDGGVGGEGEGVYAVTTVHNITTVALLLKGHCIQASGRFLFFLCLVPSFSHEAS